MIFYKYTYDCSSMNLLVEQVRSYKTKTEQVPDRDLLVKYNQHFYTEYGIKKEVLHVISDVFQQEMTIVSAYQADPSIDLGRSEESIRAYLPELILLKEEELTLEDFEKELNRASQNDWIRRSASSLCRDLGIQIQPAGYSLYDGSPYVITEKVYQSLNVTKKQSLQKLQEIMASESFYEEIDRIYSKQNLQKFLGHPVHYLITAGDEAAAQEMIDILIPALLKNKRLQCGRICHLQKIKPRAFRDENFFNVFNASKGGTLVINFTGEGADGMYATGYHELAEQLGKKLGENRNDTLFIFVDISGKRSVSNEAMAVILSQADMIQISEGYGDLKKASEYLERLAKQTDYGYSDVAELTKYLPEGQESYSVTDIYIAYHKWYGKGLKTHVYKAYKDKETVKFELGKKVDKPYDALQKMIGLTDVKKVVDEILATAKLQKMRKDMGLCVTKNALHMLFYGNPGTAKTTVARLLALILKEEEVLKNGHLVECGRQDLVGKYVGWTAKIVEEKFRAARGGILFIDEAYSLVDDRNSYGAEAINTIVQQMENYRNEVIVIFAGYPEKMQAFIDQNEGLSSRIAFHLNFPDYNAEELTMICDLMLEQQGYRIEGESTRRKIYNICAKSCQEKNYGNGRFVRNLLEHAIMRQADRLLHTASLGSGEISREEAVLLTEEDFELIGGEKKKKINSMGFCA